jgi:lipopolysaccharide/colanic/teichoic acid biosynthesis glycosyltransferase
VTRVVVSERHLERDTLLAIIWNCRQLSVKVTLLPPHFEALGGAVLGDLEGFPVLHVRDAQPSRRRLKRLADIAVAGIALVAVAPVIAACAAAIRLDSAGPVLFRQRRIGRDGRPFVVLKFRTMVTDADRMREELLASSKDPNWLLLDRDPRVTRVGRVLRLASLDELPQLWNVLRGEMSIVGPRPLIEGEHTLVTGWGRARTDVEPGLTGLWQVLGRTNIPFEEMVKLDGVYVGHRSLWRDLQLIALTVPALLFRRGAN